MPRTTGLRLLPGGRFRLAPLYDVVSVQPALAAATLPPAEAMMSLGVGKSRERVVDRMQPHHFVETGEAAGVPGRVVREVLGELIEARAGAFESVGGALPEGFPADIAAAVFDGVTTRLREVERYLTE